MIAVPALAPALLPALVLASVLVTSGIAKLRAPDTVDAAFRDLRVPSALDRPGLLRAFPWAEILLGASVLVLPGALAVLAAAAALALFLAYWFLVRRALGFEEPVSCGCFGEASSEPVTAATLRRNSIYVLLAVLWLAATALGGAGVPDLAAALSVRDLGWLVEAVLVAATVWTTLRATAPASSVATAASSLGTAADAEGAAQAPAFAADVVRAPGVDAASADGAGRDQSAEDAEDPEEYQRLPVPGMVVQDVSGQLVSLAQRASRQAVLLVNVSPGCGPCAQVMRRVPEWSRQMAPVAVSLMTAARREALEAVAPEEALPDALYDVGGFAGPMLGLQVTPSAVLVGTDGLLAGGPVYGQPAIEEFAAEIIQRMREAAVSEPT